MKIVMDFRKYDGVIGGVYCQSQVATYKHFKYSLLQ